MAWTVPRTWVAGEFVTATLLNEQIKGNSDILKTNFNDTGAPVGALYAALQTADLTKTTDTTLEDLADLLFPIAASETWSFHAAIPFTSNSTADAKFSVTAPAGATGWFGVTGGGAPIAAGTSTVFGDPVDFAVAGSVTNLVVIEGIVVNSVTPGDIQLQAAQNTSSGTSVFLENAYVRAVRIF